MTSSLFVGVRAKMNGKQYRPAGAVFAVEGTVYPGAPNPPSFITDDGNGYWCGFASGVIGGLCNVADGLWYSECIPYPAKTTPMWPSAQIGQHNLGFRVKAYADWYYAQSWPGKPAGSYEGLNINVVAWSQGGIAADLFWQVDVFPASGYLNYLKPYIGHIYIVGDPLRTSGISVGNDLAGLPGPGKLDGVTTGGIGGPKQLTVEETTYLSSDGRPVIISFNNKGDLYGAAPMGDTPKTSLPAAGKVEYGFFKIIMQPGFVDIVEIGGEIIVHPIGAVEAGWNAGKFFSEGQNASHFQYTDAMLWIINDLVAVGNSLPHQLGV